MTVEDFFAERTDDPTENLRRAAKALRRLRFPSSPMDQELVEFLAGGIERYVAGDAESLEHAFGIKNGRGAPAQSIGALAENKNFQLAIKAAPLIWKRQFQETQGNETPISWRDICMETGLAPANGSELLKMEKELPKLWERYAERVGQWYEQAVAAQFPMK